MSTCDNPRWRLPYAEIPLDVTGFFTTFLPTVLSYYGMALLVTQPGTRYLRVAFLPVCLFFVSRFALLDMTRGDHAGAAENMAILTLSCNMVMRLIPWAITAKHYTRVGKQSERPAFPNRTTAEMLWDAGDLTCNIRGVGWDYSKRNATIRTVYPDLPPTPGFQRTWAFARKVILNYIQTVILFEATYFAILLLFNTAKGSFASQIPRPILRILQAAIYPVNVYATVDGEYCLMTLIGVLVFGQDPNEWLPYFNEPWLSTSLAEFWGSRWHQVLRDLYGFTGGRFFGMLFGRLGHVMGAFFMSYLYHEIIFWGGNRTTGICCNPSLVFILAGVGVVLEILFTRTTGIKVGGMLGRIWIIVWCFGSMLLVMDESCMRDLYESVRINYLGRPVSAALGY